MNAIQLPFLVEGILMFTAGVFGILLSRAGKPYGKVKLVVHLFFFTWLTVGFGFIAYGIFTMNSGANGLRIPVTLMGLAILTQLVTGILMLAFQKAGKVFPKVHLFSAITMLLSDLSAFILAGFRS